MAQDTVLTYEDFEKVCAATGLGAANTQNFKDWYDMVIGGGLAFVTHDATLAGLGTAGSPLGVVVPMVAGSAPVVTDATLTGNGTVATPLSVVGGGDITEIIAGVNLDGGGTSGAVTVSMEPTIFLAGAADESAITAVKSDANQTVSNLAAIGGFNNGTYDTGALELFAYGVRGTFSGSRVSGTGELDATGVFGSCLGAQVNSGVVGVGNGAAALNNFGAVGFASGGVTNVGIMGIIGGSAMDPADSGANWSGYFRASPVMIRSGAHLYGALTAQGSAGVETEVLTVVGGLPTWAPGAGNGNPEVEHVSGDTLLLLPLDVAKDTSFLLNTEPSGIQVFSLADGTVDGQVHNFVNDTADDGTARVQVLVTSMDTREAGSTITSVTATPGAFSLIWDTDNDLWKVLGTPRNFTIP